MSELPVIDVVTLASDPDGVLERARAAGPVVDSDIGPVFVRHEAVRALTQDPRLRPSFSDFLHRFGITSGPFHDWMSRSPLDMEGPRHRRYRQLMAKTFTPASVEKLRPFLAEQSRLLVEAMLQRGNTAEFIGEYARKLPSLGLCELIGVPTEDRETFGDWADTIGLGFNVLLLPSRIADVDAALSELLDYARRLVEARRAEPRDDLVTRIAHAADEDPSFDPELVHGSVAGFVFAGHETTKNQLGWMIATLEDAPEEWDRVAHEPERAPAVVEEVLRLRSAATSVGRLALEDVELFGKRIAAGSSVVASLWSANRDPRQFERPDAFDVDANAGGVQLAFGSGPHHCLGAALARAELQESLRVLSRSMTCPKVLAGSEWLPPVGINGPTRLPISFERR